MRPAVALALTLVGFVALVICGLGIVSLVTDTDVIAAPGLGPVPGAAGVLAAAAAYAAVVWMGLRMRHPSYWFAAWAAMGCFVAYVVTVWVAAMAQGADIAVAMAVAGRLTTSWFGAVVAGAAAVSAWSAVALVRTRARRPRWPWEQHDPDAE